MGTCSSISVHAGFEKLCLEDLDIVRTLSRGTFGLVKLVQVRGSDRIYAMKQYEKRQIVQNKMVQSIMNEKLVMMQCRSNFIVRMYRTFQDNRYLYMLLEPCLGGDLYILLRKNGSFEEPSSRFYTGCILEALSYLHLRGIVYRDIKPENLVLDQKGYVKMVDFGFAKKIGKDGRTSTRSGTRQYIPPEIFQGKGNGLSADYWSLGILLFELLTEKPPFVAAAVQDLYHTILDDGIEGVKFPAKISESAQDLIKSLCKKEPTERLGSGGIKEIRQHKWFQDFNWKQLLRQELEAPFVPRITSSADNSNFYPEELENVQVLESWDKSGEDSGPIHPEIFQDF